MAATPQAPSVTMDPVFRKKLEFRKMLGRVSDGLGNENLRALKNLCYDIIPSTQREDVDSGVTLFNLLIEKNVINYENVTFLLELLREVGRRDLAEEVKAYCDQTQDPLNPGQPDVTLMNFPALKVISVEVGRDWKMLGRHLGLDEGTIQGIHMANFGDLHEAALQCLLRWQKNKGEQATAKALKRALTEMKLMSIVHKHFEGM